MTAKGPWWIDATERPAEYDDLCRAFVETGLCDWTGRSRPHPQEYALVALWALSREGEAASSATQEGEDG